MCSTDIFCLKILNVCQLSRFTLYKTFLFFTVDSCKDRIEGCKELASSNVCETSKDAMIVNCPHTCNFCGK